MNKPSLIIPVFLIIANIILTSCQNNKLKSTDKSHKEDSTAIVEKTESKVVYVDHHIDTLKIKNTAISFYNWYINTLKSNTGTSNIKILKGYNNKCKVDTNAYFKELRNIGTISEKFIAQEKLRFKDCIQFIEDIDYSEYINADAYAFDEHCSFLYFSYWIHSQEMADGVSVETIEKDNEQWFVTLNFYNKYDNQISYWNTYQPIITIEKENNSYFITEIKLLDKQ